MTDYESILKEFDAITGFSKLGDDSIDTKATTDVTSYRDRSPNRSSAQRRNLENVLTPPIYDPAAASQRADSTDIFERSPVDIDFNTCLEVPILYNDPPWNVMQWLMTSPSHLNVDDANESIADVEEPLFQVPLPCHKPRSERSYCSEKSARSKGHCSEKSTVSSVTLDSESESRSAHVRCPKRQVRRPVRYSVSQYPDGESDSTLAESCTEKPAVRIPRYKRPSHINAEHRRRSKIKTGFDGLADLLPPCNIPGKDTQLSMLDRAQDYIRCLHEERSDHNQELEELRLTVHKLNVDIGSIQTQLPDAGVESSTVGEEKMSQSLDELFETYIRSEIDNNWKFWIFSYLIRPLFYSYRRAMALDMCTFGELSHAVKEWVTRDMALPLLRSGSLKALCWLSKTSSVISDPSQLPQEARRSIHRPSTRPTDSGYSSTS